jgi:hypothetical protein
LKYSLSNDKNPESECGLLSKKNTTIIIQINMKRAEDLLSRGKHQIVLLFFQVEETTNGLQIK